MHKMWVRPPGVGGDGGGDGLVGGAECGWGESGCGGCGARGEGDGWGWRGGQVGVGWGCGWSGGRARAVGRKAGTIASVEYVARTVTKTTDGHVIVGRRC